MFKVKIDLRGQFKGYLRPLSKKLLIWSKSLKEKNNVDIYKGSWVIRAQSFQFDLRGQVWPQRSKTIRQWGCTFNHKVHRKKLILISITVLELQELKVFNLTSEVTMIYSFLCDLFSKIGMRGKIITSLFYVDCWNQFWNEYF